MSPLFIDTSYPIALEIVNDQSHKAAVSHWNGLMESESPSLVTSSYVFAETVTYLNNLQLHSKAIELGRDLVNSPSVNLIHVEEELFYEAWDYFEKHKDKTYSFTDCVSFVLMRNLRSPNH